MQYSREAFHERAARAIEAERRTQSTLEQRHAQRLPLEQRYPQRLPSEQRYPFAPLASAQENAHAPTYPPPLASNSQAVKVIRLDGSIEWIGNTASAYRPASAPAEPRVHAEARDRTLETAEVKIVRLDGSVEWISSSAARGLCDAQR